VAANTVLTRWGSSAPQIPQLELRGHFEAGKKRGREGGLKMKLTDRRDGRNLPFFPPGNNFGYGLVSQTTCLCRLRMPRVALYRRTWSCIRGRSQISAFSEALAILTVVRFTNTLWKMSVWWMTR